MINRDKIKGLDKDEIRYTTFLSVWGTLNNKVNNIMAHKSYKMTKLSM
jgi:hypothetical protein